MNKENLKLGFLLALGESVYVLIVALIMFNAQKFFDSTPEIFGMAAFLLLFVVSAGVSGALILGKPVLLYMEGKKSEAVKLFFTTLGWLFIFLVILLIINLK